MILLWIALLQPVPAQPAPTLILSPVVIQRELIWNPSPTPGCTYVVVATNALTQTNRAAGTNTSMKIQQAIEPRTYYWVKVVANGVESTNWNVIGVPPKLVDFVHAQRDNQDIGIVDVWTNPPALPSAQYRLRIQRTEDYTP